MAEDRPHVSIGKMRSPSADLGTVRSVLEGSDDPVQITALHDDLVLLSVPLAPPRTRLTGAESQLTAAERSVIELALAGLSNSEIAERRRSSARTIANQLAAVYKKLGVSGRRELASVWRLGRHTER